MLSLRPYQKDAVRAVAEARHRGRQRVLYQAPTGTGKTVIFCGIHQELEGKALVLAHREELLDQAAGSFRWVDPDLHVSVEQADRRAETGADIICASIPTLARGDRLAWFRPGLVIVDEAHHAVADSYLKVLRRFGCFDPEGPYLVGCTATPRRLDGIDLAQVFQEQVFTYTIYEGMRDGWLSPIRGYQVVSQVDLDKVKTLGGDFNQGQLAVAVDVEERTEAAVQHWREVAAARPTIVFCVTVQHAKNAAAAWRAIGVPAEHIDGTMDPDTRKAVLARFKSGVTRVLCNVEVLTEGFDHPPVACVVTLRPTKSWALYVQMVGRGTRGGRMCPVAGKEDLVVIDVTDNCHRHDLASVPAILGLPSGMDLQGHSLQEAADLLTQLTEKAAELSGYKPKTFEELRTMLERVDLFKGAAGSDQQRQNPSLTGARLGWTALLNGAFKLSCGGNKRQALLYQDQVGTWHLNLSSATFPPRDIPLTQRDSAAALAEAERQVIGWAGDALNIMRKDARWRTTAPSDKQRALLLEAGLSDLQIDGMTKGEASARIDQWFASRRRRR